MGDRCVSCMCMYIHTCVYSVHSAAHTVQKVCIVSHRCNVRVYCVRVHVSHRCNVRVYCVRVYCVTQMQRTCVLCTCVCVTQMQRTCVLCTCVLCHTDTTYVCIVYVCIVSHGCNVDGMVYTHRGCVYTRETDLRPPQCIIQCKEQ